MINLQTSVPQGSVPGPFFFFIYISDLLLGLTANVKLFADGTSLFSVVNNVNVSAFKLNNDLVKIRDWIFNWKYRLAQILLNKQKRLLFQQKKIIIPGIHPALSLNNSLIEQDTTQKHLGLTLDHQLTLQCHLNKKNKKP